MDGLFYKVSRSNVKLSFFCWGHVFTYHLPDRFFFTHFLFTTFFFPIYQEHVNDIDFDYMEYARQRFQQYWRTKPLLLDSVRSSPDTRTDGNHTS